MNFRTLLKKLYMFFRQQWVYYFIEHDPKKIKCPCCGHRGCKVNYEPRYNPLVCNATCDRCGAPHGLPPIAPYEAWKA